MSLTELTPPFVSVIVTARNEGEAMGDCLASLTRLDYPADRHELLVVDNASTDGTDEIIRAFPVTYLFEPRLGVCWARNRGIDASRGEVLAFTDPDCVVSTGWLRGLARPFRDSGVGAVAGGIMPYPPGTLPELHASRRRSHTQERSLAHPVRPYAMTPNVAFRREVFDRVGQFDTRFPGGGWEDADLSWRLQAETSFVIEHAPDAVVLHRYRDTYTKFFVQQYRYGFGLGVLADKYGDEFARQWTEHPLSFGPIPRDARTLAGVVLRWLLGRVGRESLGLRYLDLLRSLAQWSGFRIARHARKSR